MSRCMSKRRPIPTLCRLGRGDCSSPSSSRPCGARVSSLAFAPESLYSRDEAGELLELSKKWCRRSTRSIRNRRAENVRAQGRDGRNAPLGRQSPAPCVPRPTRGLIGYSASFSRYARHRDHERCSITGAPGKARSPATQRGAHLQRKGEASPMPCGT